MTAIAVIVSALLGIAIFPMLIPYLLLGYSTFNGLASRELVNNLRVSIGGVNVFLPDLFYAAGLILAAIGFLRLLAKDRLRTYAPSTKAAMLLVAGYFAFFAVKLVNGFLEGVPADSLVRRFAQDTQCVYMFLPLYYLQQERSLKQLLYFAVILSLLFPLAQPFLYGSADQVFFEEGQGTLRLGYGNANILLMLGALALFVWERRLWLSALPLAGIAMLGQRSAFIALTLSLMVLAFQKKRSLKFVALVGMAGVLLVGTLFAIQLTSDVPVVGKAAMRLSQTFERTGTTEGRIDVIPIALQAFGERPWVGFSYRELHALMERQEQDAFSFNVQHTHNFVLSSLLYGGMLGTILLFSTIGLVLLVGLRLTRQPATREQGMFLFSATLFFVVFSTMNTSFTSAGELFWVLAGIGLWYSNQAYYSEYQRRRAGDRIPRRRVENFVAREA